MKCTAALFLILFAIDAAGAQTAPQSSAAEIPVVSTYADLLKLPPIKVDGGITIRLGIEARECPQWGGLLLYCLPEGFELPLSWEDGENRCGPVQVFIQKEGDNAQVRARSKSESSRQENADYKHCKFLFVKPFMGLSTGTWHISVSSLSGVPLGHLSAAVTGKEFHPWMPWNWDWERAKMQQSTEVKNTPMTFVTQCSSGIALPYWDGMQPIVFDDKSLYGQLKLKHLETDKLPALVPQEPDTGLKLSIVKETTDGPILEVISDSDIFISRPDHHFLTRWWVNGESFIPQQKSVLREGYGKVNTGREQHLRLLFDAAKIGAKTGDRIGLQLLYCRNEWSSVDEIKDVKALFEFDRAAQVRLTNRVEFVAR